jgi:hypothetical protein
LEHFGANSAEDGHSLQKLDPHFIHGGLLGCTCRAEFSTLMPLKHAHRLAGMPKHFRDGGDVEQRTPSDGY